MSNVISFQSRLPFVAAQRNPIAEPSRAKAKKRSSREEAKATLETTPIIFPHVPFDVQKVCSNELGCPDVRMVQVLPGDDAETGQCMSNIAKRIAKEGGRAVFGWLIRTTPLFVAAEFYAVQEIENKLFDVTPNRRGDALVVFAPDLSVPTSFDFVQRPGPCRFSKYAAATRRQRALARISGMSEPVLNAQRRRADRSGLALEDLIATEIEGDPLEVGLDLFIECADELDGLMMRVLEGLECIDINRFDSLQQRKFSLEARVEAEWAARQNFTKH
jgi:hypothetical protein